MKKLDRKLDSVVWFLLTILPFIVYFVTSFRNAAPTDFTVFMSAWRFEWLSEIFGKIFVGELALPSPAVDYLGYYVSVLIARILVGAVTFIPRFALYFMEGSYEKINH